MGEERVRIKAVAVCFRDGRVLLERGHDRVSGEHFYRAIGGEVDFGERSADAVVREWREELATTLRNVTLLGVLENVFDYEDSASHEIVFAFAGDVADEALQAPEMVTIDSDGVRHVAVWVNAGDVISGSILLHPRTLVDLVKCVAEARFGEPQ